MRYETATAFRMALEQRMKTEAERTGSNLADCASESLSNGSYDASLKWR